MAFNSESDEVADDYRKALEDLTGNLKYEINNLTLIARESTEHAHSIADVIANHILKVAPQKKLPALYVLDSIAKNVGSPYTLFFGQSIYKMFMESYAMVDQPTRRKMEEMLKTWKEPVPGSIDRKPVFDPSIVGPIETALMKVLGKPPQQPYPPNRRLPIPGPPQPAFGQQSGPYGQQHAQMPSNGVLRPNQQYAAQQHPPQHSTPQPGASVAAPFPPPGTAPYVAPPMPAPVDVQALSADITVLIDAMRAEAVQRLHDASIQTKVSALQDLQKILQSQPDLPQEQLVLVKKQVTDLATTLGAAPAPVAVTGPPAPTPQLPTVQPPTPPSLPPVPGQQIHAFPPPPMSYQALPIPVVARGPVLSAAQASQVPAPVGPPKISLSSLLGPNAMAAIMKAQDQKQDVKIRIPLPGSQMPIRVPPQHRQPPKPKPDAMAVINILRSKGVIGKGSANPVIPLRQPQTLEEAVAGIEMTSSSLKVFRPYLASFITEKLGPQCSQCGRRFATDKEGKAKKMAHMDWHFKVHQRMAESERRGQHMCWYVEDKEWIRWEEAIDADYQLEQTNKSNGGARGGGGGGKEGSKLAKEQWIRVPDDARLKATVCPICQEKFQMSWLDEAQEFVWMDAVKVGDRVYHASCHAEAFKDREKSPFSQIRGTPEPVLGKRKAEDDYSSRTKVRIAG